MVTHNLTPTYDVILSWWISLKTDEEAARRTFTRLSDCESRGVISPDMEIIVALLPSDGDIDKKRLQQEVVKKFEKEKDKTDYTALWSSILTSSVRDEWEERFQKRTVSEQLASSFKEAITSDPLFAEKVLNNLRGAEKLGVIHPDMEIMSLLTPLTQTEILKKRGTGFTEFNLNYS